MPKRVVDGDALWRSDKLAQVEPIWMRAEYANLVPLAHANGSFEAGTRRIWSNVYSYNRPEITLEKVEALLDEFERVRLLFRWEDSTAKRWGYWVGIDKTGRLPSKSRLEKKHETLGATPPDDKLNAFLNSAGQPMASHSSTNGEVGFGFGFGFGSGFGSNTLSEDKTSSDGLNASPSKTPKKTKPKKPEDQRHVPVRDAFQSAWKEFNNAPSCPWKGAEAGLLGDLLKSVPDWNVSHFCQAIDNLFKSDDFHRKGHPTKLIPKLAGFFSSPQVGKASYSSQSAPVAVPRPSMSAIEILRQREER